MSAIATTNASQTFDHFMSLEQGTDVQAEYVWISGDGLATRSKTKTITNCGPEGVTDISQLPIWNFDGSSTGQASGNDSEVLLKPVRMIRDPFRKGNNIIVLCECIHPTETGTSISGNHRSAALQIFSDTVVAQQECWFGIEQEYNMFESDGRTPLGWPKDGYPRPQGPYYCGVGTRQAYGRNVAEAHYRACLFAGLSISGINAEVMCGQWEYQIGPCTGIDSGDQVWLSRYLLQRVSECFGVCISFDPKPVCGDWNGAGAHTNYSTKAMRESSGYKHIVAAIGKLALKHDEHMSLYGTGNRRRLTGAHETAKFDQFSYGVADRGASVRIPREAELQQCGYFEDRRPAANCDPYQVTALIAKTTLLTEDADVDQKE